MSQPAIRPRAIVFLVVLNTALACLWFYSRHQIKPIRAYGMQVVDRNSLPSLRVAPFSLTNSHGETVTEAGFLGRPWVASFIYTDCPAQCPMLATKISALQSALPAGVRIVSFSVQPEKDTPQKLAEFAERFHADSLRWEFLTGSKKQINGVLTSLGAPVNAGPDAHSLRLYLIDAAGQAAGLYDTMEESSLKNLSRDAGLLSQEKTA